MIPNQSPKNSWPDKPTDAGYGQQPDAHLAISAWQVIRSRNWNSPSSGASPIIAFSLAASTNTLMHIRISYCMGIHLSSFWYTLCPLTFVTRPA